MDRFDAYLRALRSVQKRNEDFAEMPSYPGYMVSNLGRIFNQGLYNVNSIGLVPPIEDGVRKGNVRIRSPKGYSIYVNPIREWANTFSKDLSAYLEDKSLAPDEKFKPFCMDNITYSRYIISSYGRIFDTKTYKFLKHILKHEDTYYVLMNINGVRKTYPVGWLVYLMFNDHESTETNFKVLHINNKSYDNRIQNLRVMLLTRRSGEVSDTAHTKICVEETGEEFYNTKTCADRFSVSMSEIDHILNSTEEATIKGAHIYRVRA